jgi:hypothetical protein
MASEGNLGILAHEVDQLADVADKGRADNAAALQIGRVLSQL